MFSAVNIYFRDSTTDGRISDYMPDKCKRKDRGHPARFVHHAGWKPTVLSAEIRLALFVPAAL